ncbi:MAG: pyridoxal-phosphate dependent enzyme, partial [Candidatus Thermoplasmatota archaeon]|nr:pyridoxal-phosphate dependent enzyme [Candidatus Thermoplasmatota archaeon]
GNMAASVSAYGARNDMETIVLIPSDISDKKIEQISTYGPVLIKVTGDYGDLYYKSLEVGKDEIYFTNSNSPFRVEGYKTIAFEIYEEKMPDYVIIPTSSGGLFRGLTKGFVELKRSGIIDYIPTFVSVQAEGCSPICEAHGSGEEQIERWSEPDTVASAISNPLPPGGNGVLKKLEKHGGICESVLDKDIIDAQNDIAREGIFCQPSSAVGIAALKNLRQKERIEKGADVVSIITGSGLKGEMVFDKEQTISHCDLEDLETCLSKFF